MPIKKIFCLLCMYMLCSMGCRKSLLNEKPSSEIFVPTTLEDFQSILDNDLVINYTPALGEISADDYYLTDTFWVVRQQLERNAYIWTEKIYDGTGTVKDWNIPYKQVFYANVVLESIKNIARTPGNDEKWDTMKGSALFIRGYAFHNLAQVFCRVYDPAYVDGADLGLPLRRRSDVTEKVPRSTIRQTYDQIINDLIEAAKLLPTAVSFDYRTRPNKPAAFALLSRVYLTMRNYEDAKLYADSCLQLYSSLMDYNDPSIASPPIPPFPFSNKNAESMYFSVVDPAAEMLQSYVYPDIRIDTNLLKLYAMNDLRRSVFYTTSAKPVAKATYSGNIYKYSGLATDEVFITRAECHARAGRIGDAVSDLNTLLAKRYRTGTFTPYSSSLSQQDALALILRERRKELPFRGRWADLRRLNKDGANITLKRVVYNTTYILQPNDPRCVMLIPPDVVRLGEIPDNERK